MNSFVWLWRISLSIPEDKFTQFQGVIKEKEHSSFVFQHTNGMVKQPPFETLPFQTYGMMILLYALNLMLHPPILDSMIPTIKSVDEIWLKQLWFHHGWNYPKICELEEKIHKKSCMMTTKITSGYLC